MTGGGRVVALDPRADPRCERFVAGHPDALLYHHPAWLTVLEQAYGYRAEALAYEVGPALQGLLPLVRSRGLVTGSRLSSLARTPVCGPLAAGIPQAEALVEAAVTVVRADPRMRLELRLPSRLLGEAAAGTTAVPAEPIYELELPGDGAQLRFGNSRNHGRIRWAVNKATRLGVAVREAESERELRSWYTLYVEAMRAHARPPIPLRFFKAVWRCLPPGTVRLLLAERETEAGRRLLAGSIFFLFGSTVIYAFNGRRGDELSLRPNDLLQWHAIHDAHAAGFRRYNFGQVAVGQSGLAQFKAKWGAQECAPHRYLYPPPGGRPGGARRALPALQRVGGQVVRRLPGPVAAWVGNLVYRYG